MPWRDLRILSSSVHLQYSHSNSPWKRPNSTVDQYVIVHTHVLQTPVPRHRPRIGRVDVSEAHRFAQRASPFPMKILLVEGGFRWVIDSWRGKERVERVGFTSIHIIIPTSSSYMTYTVLH